MFESEESEKNRQLQFIRAANPLRDTSAEDAALKILSSEKLDDKPQYFWQARSGVALVLEECANLISADDITDLFDFFFVHALGDYDYGVRDHSLNAGMAIISAIGGKYMDELLPLLENYLDAPSDGSSRDDTIRKALVIFVGTLGRHLEKGDDKIPVVIERLLSVLKVPEEATRLYDSVQKAVSDCLMFLVKNLPDEELRQKYVDYLMNQLVRGKYYGDRRGAAYGIAGVVKGLGISSLKKHKIMSKLQRSVENKKSVGARQGALLAFECLSNLLRLSFEPYVIQILPKLLQAFSDGSNDVRNATEDAAKAIMGNLSAHGVKLVLPALIKALDDHSAASRNWRTKIASIELLGTMAYCNPRQLSSCLPTIVPHLSAVLTDTHAKVAESARTALSTIGNVIQNPEIQAIVPTIIKAIYNPNINTIPALDALLNTAFIHVIDVASLALIMPVLQRALTERKTDVKKKSAQIVGNMCSLADHDDLAPYLKSLIPALLTIIVDPIPDVRSAAAKALGTLVVGMGEEHFSDLIPTLLSTLHSDAGSVERSGAAQALAEVLNGLGDEKLEDILPIVLDGAEDEQSHVREGSLNLFIYLPTILKEKFERHVVDILPTILEGLADEIESVRDVSMRAGQEMVTQYMETSLGTILPTLLDALFDENWRIRQSSVLLLGDLLYHVIKPENDDDEGEGMTEVKLTEKKKEPQKLNQDELHEILARLYMIRADQNSTVKQRALLVWKSVVENTPKTLREILPVLTNTIITCLGSENIEKRRVAGKTLGEIVGKLGDRVLPEIIPLLEQGLDSDNPNIRQGVCLGLSSVMVSAYKHQLAAYMSILIPAVNHALCDPLEEVRAAAAQAFECLYKAVGVRAIDDILPELIDSLESEEIGSYALDGIQQILYFKSREVLPFLIPRLLKPPLTETATNALGAIAEVSGDALYQHLDQLLPTLIDAYDADTDPENWQMCLETAQIIVTCVEDDGISLLFCELVAKAKDPSKNSRRGAVMLIGHFCETTQTDFSDQIPRLFKLLIELLNDSEPTIISAASSTLGKLVKAIPKSEYGEYLFDVRDYLLAVEKDLLAQNKTTLPGFCQKKGLEPILPIFKEGLLSGSVEIRENAARGLGDLVRLTDEKDLRLYIVHITGPLIRIIGDRFPSNVKLAILETLTLLLEKGGRMIKPFLPQLQTTFLRTLADTSEEVRDFSSIALGKLMPMHPRVDPLVTDLIAGVRNNVSMLKALQRVLLSSGDKIKPQLFREAGAVLLDLLGDPDDDMRKISAESVGAYAKHLPEDEYSELLTMELTAEDDTDTILRQGYCMAITSIVELTYEERLSTSPELMQKISEQILVNLNDSKLPVKAAAISSAVTWLKKAAPEAETLPSFPSFMENVLSMLGELTADPSGEIKIVAVRGIKEIAKHFPQLIVGHLSTLVPPLMVRVQDRTSLKIKLASERALLHVLQVHSSPSVVKDYAATLKPKDAKQVIEYTRRVLQKLEPDSGGEEK